MKLLYIINPGSGTNDVDYEEEIVNHFRDLPDSAVITHLPKDCDLTMIRDKIEATNPGRVVAVGGDGTIKLVAEAVMGTDRSIGIIPAGSANGLAKELGIPLTLAEALEVSRQPGDHPIHITRVNDHLCIHLSDMGFNAFVVKKFETEKRRGMWGYVRAAFKTLMDAPRLQVSIHAGDERIERTAAMVVIANGTRYGSGALINPNGRIDDDQFEIVLVRTISFNEIFKMMVTHRPFDPRKTEVFQCRETTIRSRKMAHFQVDGEYLGKLTLLKAALVKDALRIAIPNPQATSSE